MKYLIHRVDVVRMLRTLSFFACALAMVVGFSGLAPQPAQAHTLTPDVEPIGARLAHCDVDLFRAQQADGTYLAEVAHGLLLDFYTTLLDESMRRVVPPELGTLDPRSIPGRRLLRDMVQVSYSHDIPLRLQRDTTIRAYFDLLRSTWSRESLVAVLGAHRVVTRQGSIPGDVFGAALLAMAAGDFHDRIAWGPQHLINTIETARDPASWSLDGSPLTTAQFQALVADYVAEVASMNANGKVDFVGGHCLHFHSEDLGLMSIAGGSGDSNQDEEESPPPNPIIYVVGQLPPTLRIPLTWLINRERPRDEDGGAGEEIDPGEEPPTPPPAPPEDENPEPAPPETPPDDLCQTGFGKCSTNCTVYEDCLDCCERSVETGTERCDSLRRAGGPQMHRLSRRAAREICDGLDGGPATICALQCQGLQF